VNSSSSAPLAADEMDYLLALSGGHPRSLALLKNLVVSKGQRSLPQLVADWRNSVMGFVGRVTDDVMKEVLAWTLLGITVGVEETLAGVCPKTGS
jgi:hypothetical protein